MAYFLSILTSVIVWIASTYFFEPYLITFSNAIGLGHQAFILEFALLFIFIGIAVYAVSEHKNSLIIPSNIDDTLQKRVSNRFPANVNFRPTQGVIKYFNSQYVHRQYHPYAFYDLSTDDWNKIFQDFPSPPATEQERINNERRFWSDYASKFTVRSIPDIQLSDKQTIINKFRNSEKFIFCHYYAATGIVHAPYSVLLSEFITELLSAQNLTHNNDKDSSKRDSAIDRATEQIKRFRREHAEPHLEKWGEWFFFHIESAFIQQQKDSDRSPSRELSPNRGIDDGTQWNPKI